MCLFALSGCSTPYLVNPNIAFMGDSITAFWKLPSTNLGVAGDTTADMLARYPSEVNGHRFKALVLLGGTNDVRQYNTPVETDVDTAIANLGQMASMAESAKMVVVFCTIPPVQSLDSKVRALNSAILKLAQQHHGKIVDYYTPMEGHPEYFTDSVHPNALGYQVMQKTLIQVLPLDY